MRESLLPRPNPRFLRLFSACAALATLFFMTSCAGVYYYGPTASMGGQTSYLTGYGPAGGSMPPRIPGSPTDTNSWFKGDGAPGAPHVVISLSKQQAFFYKGGQLVGVSALSTGDVDHPTPTGRYTISQKSQFHKSSQYGDYVDYNGNVVASNIDRRSDPQPPGTKYDGASMPYFMRFNGGIGMHAGYLPGYPASHGCVRMPVDMAQAFFRNVSVGTPVEVRY